MTQNSKILKSIEVHSGVNHKPWMPATCVMSGNVYEPPRKAGTLHTDIFFIKKYFSEISGTSIVRVALQPKIDRISTVK